MSPISPDLRHAGRGLVRAARLELARLRRIRGPGARTARRIARARVALAAGLLGIGLGEAARARTPIFVDPLLPFGLTDVGEAASPDFADLDGDGDLDALVGESDGKLLYFTNTGTKALPAFGAPAPSPFGLVVTEDFSAPTFADIDADGDLDVFVGGVFGATVMHSNTGSASAPAFAPPTAFPLPGFDFFASPEFADLDGDGDLDAFVGEGYGNTFHFENTGTAGAPAFAAAVTNPFGLADVGTRATPRFGDLDGDGDLDALVGNDVGHVLLFVNTGTVQAPAFAPAVTNPFGLGDVGDVAAPAFADLDDDGDVDVLVGALSGNVVLFSNGGEARAPAFLGPVALADVVGFASPTFGDLDGDGDLDALVGDGPSGNQVLIHNVGTARAPAFGLPSSNPFGLGSVAGYSFPELGDLDGDGDLDALVGVGSSGGSPLLFSNTGTATLPAFAAPVTSPFGLVGLELAAPTLADLDADGDLDALVGRFGGDTAYFANTGTRTEPAFAEPTVSPFGLASAGDVRSPTFTDVDDDGDLDLFMAEIGGSLVFVTNAGTPASPAFVAPLTNPFGLVVGGGVLSPAFADVDDDGDPDAFVGSSLGTTTFFANLTPLCPEAPEPGCAAFVAGSLSVDERKEGNEKLALKLTKGPELAQSDFGAPTVPGAQAISACLYDGNGKRAAALEVRRGGDDCGAKPCWKPIGRPSPDGKGFAYKDPTGEADGVRSLKLAGGAEGRSSLALTASNRAKKDERALPTGIALALAASPQATIQVHGPGACFEVELTEVTKQEADRFKARSVER